MKVSIAVTTYNGEKYLEKQLESFCRQTRLPDEVVISDDGSADSTLCMARQFADGAPFEVKVSQNKKNLGYAQNFATAMEMCSGDVVFLSDQDDVWRANKIARILDAFGRYPAMLLLINDAEIVNESLVSCGVTKRGQTLSLQGSDNSFITGCCTALRKELLALALPVPQSEKAHDHWLHALALRLGVRRVIPETLQYYRRHGENTSSALSSNVKGVGRAEQYRAYAPQDPRPWCEKRLELIEELHDRIRKHGPGVLGTLGLEERAFQCLRGLERERQAVGQRLEALNSCGVSRLAAILTLYARGRYAYFSGWRSFAKDMVGVWSR